MNKANCINKDCMMREKCSHAIVYNNVRNDETFEIINPDIIKTDAEGKCQFYTEPKVITLAYGFNKATEDMSQRMNQRLNLLGKDTFCHTTWFKMKSGSRVILPEEQERIFNILRDLGYTPTPSFWNKTEQTTQYFEG